MKLLMFIFIGLGLIFLYIVGVSPSNKVFEPNDAVNGIGFYFAGYEKEEVPFAYRWNHYDTKDSIFITYYSQGRFPHYGMSRAVRIFNVDSLEVLNFITKHGGEITTEWTLDEDGVGYHFDILNSKNKKEFRSFFNSERHRLTMVYVFDKDI